LIREWSKTQKLYIICGGYFGSKKVGNIAVPEYCWKVVQSVKTKEVLFCGWFKNSTNATLEEIDGLPGSEGAFLACSFWLADNYALTGRQQEAEEYFERLLSLRNPLGLLAEEYDPRLKRQIGNFPQAFSHLALIATAHILEKQTFADKTEFWSEMPMTTEKK
jgi:hypothetical protein